MGINFGYIRGSTNEQNSDRQLEAIKPYITNEKYLYSDKTSGKDVEHEGFWNMLKAMRDGDTLYIKSIDRLGRNKVQLKKYLEQFKNEGIRIKIIDLPKEWDRLYKEWIAGKITAVAFMKEVGMKKSTFYNKVKLTRQGSNILFPFYFVGHASKIGDVCYLRIVNCS